MSAEAVVSEPVGVDKELAEIEKQLESLPTPSEEAQPSKQSKQEPEQIPAEKQAVQPANKEEQKANEQQAVQVDEEKKPEKLSNEDWAAARVAASKKLEKAQQEWSAKEKQLSDEINALKVKYEQQPVKTEPQKREAQNALPPEQVFAAYHNALSGKIENAEAVINAAKTIIGKMSHEDIQKVIGMAETGLFGSSSNDILNLAKEEIGVATARWITDQKIKNEQEAKRQEFFSKRNASFKKVVETYPELKDQNSELFKAIPALREKYIGKFSQDGTVISKGPLFDLIKEADWPERVTPLFIELFNAQKNQTANATTEKTKQIEELKRSPESGGHSGARQPITEVEAIEKQLEALGTIGPGG